MNTTLIFYAILAIVSADWTPIDRVQAKKNHDECVKSEKISKEDEDSILSKKLLDVPGVRFYIHCMTIKSGIYDETKGFDVDRAFATFPKHDIDITMEEFKECSAEAKVENDDAITRAFKGFKCMKDKSDVRRKTKVSADWTPADREQAKKYHDECVKSEKISKEDEDSIMSEKLLDVPGVRLYIHCMTIKSGIYDETKGFDVDRAFATFPKHDIDITMEEFKECSAEAKVENDDAITRAFKGFKCMKDKSDIRRKTKVSADWTPVDRVQAKKNHDECVKSEKISKEDEDSIMSEKLLDVPGVRLYIHCMTIKSGIYDETKGFDVDRAFATFPKHDIDITMEEFKECSAEAKVENDDAITRAFKGFKCMKDKSDVRRKTKVSADWTPVDRVQAKKNHDECVKSEKISKEDEDSIMSEKLLDVPGVRFYIHCMTIKSGIYDETKGFDVDRAFATFPKHDIDITMEEFKECSAEAKVENDDAITRAFKGFKCMKDKSDVRRKTKVSADWTPADREQAKKYHDECVKSEKISKEDEDSIMSEKLLDVPGVRLYIHCMTIKSGIYDETKGFDVDRAFATFPKHDIDITMEEFKECSAEAKVENDDAITRAFKGFKCMKDKSDVRRKTKVSADWTPADREQAKKYHDECVKSEKISKEDEDSIMSEKLLDVPGVRLYIHCMTIKSGIYDETKGFDVDRAFATFPKHDIDITMEEFKECSAEAKVENDDAITRAFKGFKCMKDKSDIRRKTKVSADWTPVDRVQAKKNHDECVKSEKISKEDEDSIMSEKLLDVPGVRLYIHCMTIKSGIYDETKGFDVDRAFATFPKHDIDITMEEFKECSAEAKVENDDAITRAFKGFKCMKDKSDVRRKTKVSADWTPVDRVQAKKNHDECVKSEKISKEDEDSIMSEKLLDVPGVRFYIHCMTIKSGIYDETKGFDVDRAFATFPKHDIDITMEEFKECSAEAKVENDDAITRAFKGFKCMKDKSDVRRKTKVSADWTPADREQAKKYHDECVKSEKISKEDEDSIMSEKLLDVPGVRLYIHCMTIKSGIYDETKGFDVDRAFATFPKHDIDITMEEFKECSAEAKVENDDAITRAFKGFKCMKDKSDVRRKTKVSADWTPADREQAKKYHDECVKSEKISKEDEDSIMSEKLLDVPGVRLYIHCMTIKSGIYDETKGFDVDRAFATFPKHDIDITMEEFKECSAEAKVENDDAITRAFKGFKCMKDKSDIRRKTKVSADWTPVDRVQAKKNHDECVKSEKISKEDEDSIMSEKLLDVPGVRLYIHCMTIKSGIYDETKGFDVDRAFATFPKHDIDITMEEFKECSAEAKVENDDAITRAFKGFKCMKDKSDVRRKTKVSADWTPADREQAKKYHDECVKSEKISKEDEDSIMSEKLLDVPGVRLYIHCMTIKSGIYDETKGFDVDRAFATFPKHDIDITMEEFKECSAEAKVENDDAITRAFKGFKCMKDKSDIRRNKKKTD